MSKVAEALETVRSPGDIKPDDPLQRWVVCLSPPDGNCGRWMPDDNRLKAAGYLRGCYDHAARARGDRRIQQGSDLEVFTGAIYHLGEVVPDEPDKRYVTCPICHERHTESSASKKELKLRRGICADCLPWATLALKPKDYTGDKSERDAIYVQIKRICDALKAPDVHIPRGLLMPSMPFWTLAKNFIEEFPDAAPQSNKSKSTHVRYLTLFFEHKPIGEIDLDSVQGFTYHMGAGISRWGTQHSGSTVGRMVGTLKRMFSFAKEHGWIARSPFPRGVRLYPRIRFSTTRIMTLDEDDKLRAACVDDLALLTSFIYMADTGTAQSTILGLRWTDVDFTEGTVGVPGGSVEMTPRLADVLRLLLESTESRSADSLISRTRDQLYRDWDRARKVAAVRRLKPIDVRRTCAWRMSQAGWRESRIADALGCTLETVGALLVVDRETADSEIASPAFQQFISKQFEAAVKTPNGDGIRVLTGGDVVGDKKSKAVGVVKNAGRPRKFADRQAYQAIDKLGSRVSVSSLAKSLECSRPTVNDWAHDKGYSSLAELVTARRTQGV
jgi:integrase